MAGSLILSVESWACSIPLETPISFGSFEVTARDYTALRLTTADGRSAACLGHTRGSPLDVVLIDLLAPRLVGQDAAELETCMTGLNRAVTAMDADGVIGRALSLVEICLWDLRAQARGVPLWQLLSGRARPLPLLLVEGYALKGETPEDFVRRLVERVRQGYRLLKIEAAHYDDPRQLRDLIQSFRGQVGPEPRLVLDLAWKWKTAEDGAASCKAWANLGIDWIEDVMPRSQVAEIARLRAQAGLPIGIGDETTRPGDLVALLEARAIDVTRIDATTLGGIAPALDLARGASKHGRISFHVNPEVHEHCAYATEAADHIEAFPPDRPFDMSHKLVRSDFWQRVADGSVRPGETPGTGITLNDAALTRYAYRAARVDAGRPARRISNLERNI